MNYEEMLNAREGAASQRRILPWGAFYKKQTDNRYHNIVELRPELADNLLFCEGLKRDQRESQKLNARQQLHYTLTDNGKGISEIDLQVSSCQTLAQLLEATPAIVAEKGFVDRILADLMAFCQELHEKGIYHLCFDPRTIFMQKRDSTPMLLCHGSSFMGMNDQGLIYQGYEQSVAPEVLDGGDPDERSDVFALGRLVEKLYESGELPFEYKTVIKKATDPDPDKRYATISKMQEALNAKRSTRRSIIMAVAAFAVVALMVFLYFDLVPETSNIEFVDDNGVREKPDPFSVEYETEYTDEEEPYLDPEIMMYLDSVEPMTDEEVKYYSDSLNASRMAEQIFNRRFTTKATEKLSKLYSNDQMGTTEPDFYAKSKSTMDELYNYATELGQQAGLPAEKANSIASQIISHLQAEMNNKNDYGSRTKPEEE